MGFEQKVNNCLRSHPVVKKGIKSIYQHIMYATMTKIKCEGDIQRISPNDPMKEYFFGYYDKSPWDITDRYVLCLKANDTWSDASPREKADILLIDTEHDLDEIDRVKKIAETNAWNVQQGCMLQWLGPDYSSRIIYNDYRNGKYVAVIRNIENGNERLIPAPIYTVSTDGKTALTLDFSRLYNLRPGYGYYNMPEKTKGVGLPDDTAIWKIDLENGQVWPLLSYKDFALFQPRPEMQELGCVHKVNHLMLSPSGKRCMVLYRWFVAQRKYTRLITFDTADGKDMYVLSDDDMVSHCFWKDDDRILAFENKKEGGPGYYLMKDKTQEYIHCWSCLSNDGHPSYSPDGKIIVTDTYPNRARVAEIKVMNGTDEKRNEVKTIARVFSPFKYDNDTRCDLHPRWNHASNTICFDSVYEGHRGLYSVRIPSVIKALSQENLVSEVEKVSCVIPSYKRCDTVTRAIDSALAQTYRNIEVCIVDDNVPGDEYSSKLQETLKKYENDPRVRYIAQEKHINGAVARNVGIKEAKGSFIAFLDDDDEWLPDKIEQQMKVLQSDPSLDAVTTLWTIYEGENVKRTCAPYTADNLQFKVFLRDVTVFTSTVLIKREAINRFGGFDEKLIRHQDLQFLVDALKESKFEVIPQYLVKLHSDSGINKPDVKKFIDVKKSFFSSVEEEYKKYGKKDQKRIRNAHYYEIVFQALKAKKYIIVIQYGLKAGFSTKSIKDLMKRRSER